MKRRKRKVWMRYVYMFLFQMSVRCWSCYGSVCSCFIDSKNTKRFFFCSFLCNRLAFCDKQRAWQTVWLWTWNLFQANCRSIRTRISQLKSLGVKSRIWRSPLLSQCFCVKESCHSVLSCCKQVLIVLQQRLCCFLRQDNESFLDFWSRSLATGLYSQNVGHLWLFGF